MLYSSGFLLLHFPKTAGKSISAYFCNNFPKPVYGHISPGQVKAIGLGPDDGVFLEPTWSHDNFKSAKKKLDSHFGHTAFIKKLILPIRNPYDLYVSNYFYLRQTYHKLKSVREVESFKLAASLDFPDFCEQFRMGNFSGFLPNLDEDKGIELELVRFEKLRDDLRSLLERNNIEETYSLPHINPSDRPRSYSEMYSKRTKEIVDKVMHEMFVIGKYEKVLP